MTQERSSPEFVGVRRGSSGPNLLRENVVAKMEKLVIKNAILLSACCFSMRFRGENVKKTRRKCLDIFARKVKFVGVLQTA